ncbi:zinc-binding dehydrogenase [Paenibacillus alkalitolerans]|uniref:zinc-binding dehydrogenase n=1 Tax=Paenibacillus alkalitolerans TaxID=2799335 RepID=UPI0018F70141|nr:zinc-binding dehydrogenase [Paenibacillus alkalitolerans]
MEKAKGLGIKALKPSQLSTKEDLETIAHLFEEEIVKTFIARTFPLHEAGFAHELSQRGHGRGRIVLHISDLRTHTLRN